MHIHTRVHTKHAHTQKHVLPVVRTTCMHTYAHTHICAHTHACPITHEHRHTHSFTNSYTYARARAGMCTRTHRIREHTNSDAHQSISIHALAIQKHAFACTCAHTHTHTKILMKGNSVHVDSRTVVIYLLRMTIDNIQLLCDPTFQRHQSNNIAVAESAKHVKYACSSIGYCNSFLFGEISNFTVCSYIHPTNASHRLMY